MKLICARSRRALKRSFRRLEAGVMFALGVGEPDHLLFLCPSCFCGLVNLAPSVGSAALSHLGEAGGCGRFWLKVDRLQPCQAFGW